MRVAVTGVAGFIGSSLADLLLDRGHEVVGIDSFVDYYPREVKEQNLERARSFERFHFVEADLVSLPLERTLAGAEWIFHQAAQAGVRASWGENFTIYTHNNVLATQCLLEACRKEGIRDSLRRVVYASSSSVYGHAETLPTGETVRPMPISPYGVTKLAAEHLAVLYAREFNVPTVSLRYFTVYGPRQRPDMAFHRFARAALSGEELTIYDDGEQTRDFTFIGDIVEANVQAAERGSSGGVYNLGGGSRVSVNEVLALLESILGRKVKRRYLAREAGDARHTGADTARARADLNFFPKTLLRDGIAAEVEWLRETHLRRRA